MRICPNCGATFPNGEAYCPNDGTPTRTPAPSARPSQPPPDPLLGRVIDGRYRIEKQIGEGGMGIVYLATHTTLGKKLALKVLRGDMAKDGDVTQRFMQEARAATEIRHENIIDITDFGQLPDKTVYFVMEFLDGEALTDMIGRGGSIPMATAMLIIRQVASALGAAHARGIVHRDLKPDNIYLIKRGEDGLPFVKVLDFGIAKVGGAASKLTKTGQLFGTPHYMSPEQAAGQPVDQRTDIYALGVIMYEVFTGKVPFDADTFMGILTKHMFEQPVPPSQINGDGPRLGAIEDITLKALTKKPEDRYQSMQELIADLQRVAEGGSVQIGGKKQSGMADQLEPPSRTEMRLSNVDGIQIPGTSKTPMYLGIGVAAVLVASGAIWGLSGGSGSTAHAPAPPAPPPPTKVVVADPPAAAVDAGQVAVAIDAGTTIPVGVEPTPPPPTPTAEHRPSGPRRPPVHRPPAKTGGGHHRTDTEVVDPWN